MASKNKYGNSKKQLQTLLIWLLGISTSLGVIVMPVTVSPRVNLKPHPLPVQLVTWQDPSNAGDYFTQIKPTSRGYLIWSRFPVQVYIERPNDPLDTAASTQRFQQWTQAVFTAMQEWSQYLPLVEVGERENADIVILRSHPPSSVSFDRKTGQFQLPRARAAQTSYEFYLKQHPGSSKILAHRFTIHLSPAQTNEYTLATARHELGHALGIWGHSFQPTDSLYFSQVRYPPGISVRDVNTLKKIYQQPTSLGWSISASGQL